MYDGDGSRVKATVGGVTTAYVGNYYEWAGSTTTAKKYYYAGGQRIAMRTGSTTLNYLLGDHLGSMAITTNNASAKIAEVRYKAWGENRYTSGTTPTTFRYTGQRQESGLGGPDGLYYYGARWYDPALGRFAQADTIVPGAGNPQSFNRYSYTLNNPMRYIDPSGHDPVCGGANEDPECDPEYEDNWSPSTPLAPIIPMLSTLAESWSQITDVYDLLARAILTEEGNKVLTNKWEDALGAGWVMWRHAIENTQGQREPTLQDLLDYLLTRDPASGQWRIAGVGSYKLTRAAFNPGANPSYYSADWQANPQGHEAYAAALNMAYLIVDGDPAKDDVTYGALYYADAYADGRRRERTAFWKVFGSPYDSPTDPHLTIPQLRMRYGPPIVGQWGSRR